MIIARFQDGSNIDAVLGLDAVDIGKLLRGGPVEVDLNQVGLKLTLMLVHERTNQQVTDKLQQFVTSDTILVGGGPHKEGNA